jgi:hypothetical protein
MPQTTDANAYSADQKVSLVADRRLEQDERTRD